MKKRLIIAGCLLAAGIVGCYLAYVFSRSVPYSSQYPDAYTYSLLFNPAAWIIPIVAFLGIFLRALSKASGDTPVMKEGKVLRHDEHTFLSHWSHVLAVVILGISGLHMGPFGMDRLVHTPEASGFALNLHFMGIVVFVFGFSYFASDLFLKGAVKGHLPGIGDFKDAVIYYSSKIGMGQRPDQGKYLSSEKLVFPLWIVLLGGIIISGGIKIAAHVWSLPSALMGVVTPMHDGFALALLILVAIHVLLGSVVPWSWPLLRSMVTGYVREDYVQENHALWYRGIGDNSKG